MIAFKCFFSVLSVAGIIVYLGMSQRQKLTFSIFPLIPVLPITILLILLFSIITEQ